MSEAKPQLGAKLVTLVQLAAFKAPSPEGRWHPIDHAAALDITETALQAGGHRVTARELYVLRGGSRFVAILDLDAQIAERTTLAVGITSSTDQSLPFSFFAGHRSQVTGCSSFRSDLFVRRKHTSAGEGRFSSEVSAGVGKLTAFSEGELERIARMERTGVDPRVGDSVILRAFERGILPARGLARAVRDWRKPPHETFASPTFWSLASSLSAVVAQCGRREVYRKHVRATMQLNALLDAEPELCVTEEPPAS